MLQNSNNSNIDLKQVLYKIKLKIRKYGNNN